MATKKEKQEKAIILYKTLYKALLLDTKMDKALYEFDLEEHVEHWKEELRDDKDDFSFAITENSG